MPSGAIAGTFALWILFLFERLGTPWLPVGLVGIAGLVLALNRFTKRPVDKTGQPTPERRVISPDQDRWGGGA